MLDSSNAVVWSWEDREPFGASLPTEGTVGGTPFVFNLRFPGQWADAESGLVSNGFRDYDPVLGKYVEVDPLGLAAGMNPFGYVSGKPTLNTDRLGLDDSFCMRDPASCGWPTPVNRYVNGGVGLNATVVGGPIGGQAEIGILIDNRLNACFYGRVCGMAATGMGAYGGASGALIMGNGALESGTKRVMMAAGEGGEIIEAGGACEYDPDEMTGGVSRAFIGAGGGAYGGIFECTTTYYCVKN